MFEEIRKKQQTRNKRLLKMTRQVKNKLEALGMENIIEIKNSVYKLNSKLDIAERKWQNQKAEHYLKCSTENPGIIKHEREKMWKI